MSNQSTWFCAHTTGGAEAKLEAALARIEVTTYLPRVLSQIRNPFRDGHFTHRRVAFFPGDLFAAPTEMGWYRIKSDMGVAARPRWVEFGAGPVEIPNELIDSLRAAEHKGLIVPRECEVKGDYVEIQPGERVSILAGPWKGFAGVFHAQTGLERVSILLNVLGAERPVEFVRQDIRAAS